MSETETIEERTVVETIYDFLVDSSSKWPGKTAVVKGEAGFSYNEIDQKTEQLSKRLKKNGIKKGDRVGVFLSKTPEEVASMFAIAETGAIFVILNAKLKKEQIVHIINDCRIKAVISNRAMCELVLKDCIAGTSVEFLLFADNDDYDVKIVGSRSKEKTVSLPDSNIACVIYTSGSTGMPKGVVITHQGLIDGAEIVSEYLDCRHEDRVLSLLPFSFDYGLNQLMTTFKNGATIVLKEFVFPEDVLRTIEEENITALAGIPTIWLGLMNSKAIGKYDYSTLRYITNSGGKIPVEYVKKLIKVFDKTKINLMYGLTEAFRSTYLPSELVRERPDSMGKAIPRVKISVLNKQGNECKSGEEGYLWHRGALISEGYWGNEEATKKRIMELPEGAEDKLPGEKGVFSGDIVKRDEEGFLYFVGRDDEMIKSSGYRISPAEIEEVLYKIDGLTDAVVFGVEDPLLGQKIRAVIRNKKNISKEDIIDHCRQHLPEYAIPGDIIMLDKLPQTSSGKLDRSLIKEQYGK